MFKYWISQLFQYSISQMIQSIIQLGCPTFEHGRGPGACSVHDDWLQTWHKGHHHWSQLTHVNHNSSRKVKNDTKGIFVKKLQLVFKLLAMIEHNLQKIIGGYRYPGYPAIDCEYFLLVSTDFLMVHRLRRFFIGPQIVKMKNGKRSVAFLRFKFQRAIGFYVLQVRIIISHVVQKFSYYLDIIFWCDSIVDMV